MLQLHLAGPHTRLGATLCARCPQGPAGCCASPPAVAWADLGRIVSLGGLRWLLDEMAAGRLRPGGRGLVIKRTEPRQDEGVTFPAKCIYHGPRGCTIPPERRSATCNYYVCDDAFADGGEAHGEPAAVRARAVHGALEALYARWDLELAERIRVRWPEGPPWGEPLLEWLGEEFQRLAAAGRETGDGR